MFKNILFIFTVLIASKTQALPIDWHGVLAFDTNIINSYRRIDSSSFSGNTDGTQEIELPSGKSVNGNFQSYIFRLQPNIIINDSATIKAELSSGYARGGYFGANSSTTSARSGFANQLYPYNFSNGSDGLVVNQLYAELYSDTATYVIGRHPQHFGLGAVVDSGEDTWDRFFYLRDGITVKIKLGNFKIEPFWTRVSQGNSLTKGTRIKDYGASLAYDSVERDMGFGVLYSKKQSTASNTDYQTTVNSGTTQNLGATDVKMIDVFFKKGLGNFDFGLEVPILSGEVGNVFTGTTTYKAKAYVFESNYKASNSWSFGIDAGKVNGDDGSAASYDAMYLNPNYQVANLLFRYNLRAIANNDPTGTGYNVYDSYINNALYLKARAEYATEKWRWDFAFIYAKADQTAEAGKTAYNHLRNEQFNANFTQSDDLGMEIDTNFEYKWNSEISVGGNLGYLFTGDYFGYTNTATENPVENSYVIRLNTAIRF